MGAEGDNRILKIPGDLERALHIAFAALAGAEDRFHAETMPHVPLGRPRIFRVTRYYWPVAGTAPGSLLKGTLGSLPWPKIKARDHNQWSSTVSPTCTVDSYFKAATEILLWTGGQPRRIWRVIQQIKAIAAWCEKRAEGRKRAAAEILRQQSRWITKVASEVLVEEMAGRYIKQQSRAPNGSGFFEVERQDGSKMKISIPYWSGDNDQSEET